jgi:hypothetical protein
MDLDVGGRSTCASGRMLAKKLAAVDLATVCGGEKAITI